MTLPNCYRCGTRPCSCRDGCTLWQGDCLGVMAGMEAGSVQTCVTSPPYWGLRQYLFDGAVVLRSDLTKEQRDEVIAELEEMGVTPKC